MGSGLRFKIGAIADGKPAKIPFSLFQFPEKMQPPGPVQAPAVVIEVGFLTNEKDVELLAKPEFREQVSDSIARGLAEFLRSR